MAERRMFSKLIIDSDAFLDMPLSTQALYFHLGMRADDEGFINNPKKIMRFVGATQNELEILLAKRYLLSFHSGVVVIKHWKIHNIIRKDRLKKTLYQEEKNMLFQKKDGIYTDNEIIEETQKQAIKIQDKSALKRAIEYKKSSLPSTFNGLIRDSFFGESCPICGEIMLLDEYGNNHLMPTIQHNIPISKGGKHELGNISVICKKCNISIRDNETTSLNSSRVNEIWARLQDGGHFAVKCTPSIGEDSIGEYRLVEDSYNSCNSPKKSDAPKQPKKINYTDEFNQFWECYPKSRRVGKAKAFLSWKKMKPPIKKCLETLAIFKASKQWTDKGGQFIPHPTTWLNRGGWEDETENIVDMSNPWKGEMNFEL